MPRPFTPAEDALLVELARSSHQLGQAEIAARLGRPEGSIGSRLSRLRRSGVDVPTLSGRATGPRKDHSAEAAKLPKFAIKLLPAWSAACAEHWRYEFDRPQQRDLF